MPALLVCFSIMRPGLAASRSIAPGPAAPIDRGSRVASIDTIRGFALLGILAINIVGFAQPYQSMSYPTVAGGFHGVNFFLWCVADLLVEGKMRAIFSMLFGASVILFTAGKEARVAQGSIADLYYRRTLWLIAFGVLHAYCLWPGDILYAYGVTGLLLYTLRNVAPKRLIVSGLILLAVFSVKTFRHGWELAELRDKAREATEAVAAGRTPTREQAAASQHWDEQFRREKPDIAAVNQMIRSRRVGYWEGFSFRSARARETQSVEFYKWEFWDVCGMMLIGMGLFKLGFFSARRPYREYVCIAVVGYAIGVSLGSYFLIQNVKADFDPAIHTLLSSGYQLVRLSVALGHVAVLALLCQSGILSGLTTRLAAIGQMALSNYILDTVVCTFVFYGYGLGLYGSLQRWQYYLVALGIWCVQLIASPIWLEHFRFGPLEWLWRSLTYWAKQPMRLQAQSSKTT